VRKIVYVGAEIDLNMREALIARGRRGADVTAVIPLLPEHDPRGFDGLDCEFVYLDGDPRGEGGRQA
jgi:hypothetical protein